MHPMLNIAVRAARRAGAIINRAALDSGGLRVTSKRAKDFVTQVDHAAEEAIIDIVKKAYPEHGFLAEESGAAKPDAEVVWIIDPLDGTTNFIHGFPQYCVSIGIQHRGALAHAVIYDPSRNELFTASKGRDAFWELGLSPWDMAAGALLIQEAGGLVGDLDGEQTYLESGDIAAATPKVFSAPLDALR